MKYSGLGENNSTGCEVKASTTLARDFTPCDWSAVEYLLLDSPVEHAFDGQRVGSTCRLIVTNTINPSRHAMDANVLRNQPEEESAQRDEA